MEASPIGLALLWHPASQGSNPLGGDLCWPEGKNPLACPAFLKAQVANRSTHRVTGACVRAGYGVPGFFSTCVSGLILKAQSSGPI